MELWNNIHDVDKGYMLPSACTRKRQAKRLCLGTEEAAEDDGCSASAQRDNIGDERSTDSSNDSDSDSSEDVNAQRWVFRL